MLYEVITPVVYLVDSFGSMYCEQIEMLAKKYQTYMPGKTIGLHMHNNMQLAFSNTITGIINVITSYSIHYTKLYELYCFGINSGSR